MVEHHQQLSIMHHALEIDDVLHTILQHLKSSTTDLLNIAMTCSKLSDPALNMLWCEQSSLAPLVMCLPQDTWEVTHDGTIVFSREPLLTEWERVRINASRIRRLVSNSNHSLVKTPRPGFNFSHSRTGALSLASNFNHSRVEALPVPSGPVLQQLFALFPPALLFRNLYALHFDVVSHLPEFRSNFLLLRQFLLPELEILTFNVPVDVPTPEVEQLLGALSVEVSGLRQLSIMADNGLSASRFIVPQLPKLDQLSIGEINVRLMRQNIPNIQHSRCLQTLELTLRGSFNMENLSGNMPLELSTLKNLILFGTRLQDCTSFLLQVATPQLSAIETTYRTAASPIKIAAFIESLAASCRTSGSLEKISVVDCSPRQRWDPEIPDELHSHIFRPLLQFRTLSTVKFVDIGRYCLDNAFIEDVAVAWPGLYELRFASVKHGACEVTFTAMLSLASKCKSLRTLQLTFDGATRFPTLPYAPDGTRELWPTQTALHELHVGHSRVSAESCFHLFLAVVFPSLAHLTRYDMRLEDDSIMWRQTKKLWEKLVKDREMFPAMAATWRDSLLPP